ncbi:MAG: 50S ribosomal protein L10 [Pirellulales bacterium]
MSKPVKDLVTGHLKRQLEGVEELLLVNVIGLSANHTTALRRQLREKNIRLLVVKNSLARRATEGTQLAGAFEGSTGSLAMVWGAADIVTLAKEVARLARDKKFEKFRARGGVMGGAALKPQEVDAISRWPTREEQLSILMGQILSPGARLASQLNSGAGSLASQIKQISEKSGSADDAAPEAGNAAAAGEMGEAASGAEAGQ